MPQAPRSINHLLQSLPVAEFEALRPHLELVELDRETVLVEAGARLTHVYLPQSAIISMTVRLSEGQSVEVALVGRDGVFGASAALDGGIALTDAAILLSGTASILNAAALRAAAERSAALRALLARHEQCLACECYEAVKVRRDQLLKPSEGRYSMAGG